MPDRPPDRDALSRRLPALGPHGEGWFAIQLVLFALTALAGTAGPAWSGVARLVSAALGGLLIVSGGVLAARGLLDLRHQLSPFPRPLAGARLVDGGAYRLVRHPIYGGIVIAALGWGLATASPAAVLATAVLFGFFELKSRREEIWLERDVAGYAAYRRRTRRMLPWLH